MHFIVTAHYNGVKYKAREYLYKPKPKPKPKAQGARIARKENTP